MNGDDLKVVQDNPESLLNLTSPETQHEGSSQSGCVRNDKTYKSHQKGDQLQPQKTDNLHYQREITYIHKREII